MRSEYCMQAMVARDKHPEPVDLPKMLWALGGSPTDFNAVRGGRWGRLWGTLCEPAVMRIFSIRMLTI